MFAIKLTINLILMVVITAKILPAHGTESVKLALNDGHFRSPAVIGTESIQSCTKDEDCSCISDKRVQVKGCCVAKKCSCVLKTEKCRDTFSRYSATLAGPFSMWSTFTEEEYTHPAVVTVECNLYPKGDEKCSAPDMYSYVDYDAIVGSVLTESPDGACLLGFAKIEPAEGTKSLGSMLVSNLTADQLLQVLKEDVLDQLLRKYKSKYPNKVL